MLTKFSISGRWYMLSEDAVAEHLTPALELGERFSQPFNLTLFHPFSPEFYSQILAQLPEDRFYEPLMHRDARRPDGTSTRMIMSIDKESTDRLPAEQREFWSAFNAIMRSKKVRDAFMRHLEPELTARFKVPLDEIPCQATVRIGRDADGYKISPHPDNANRVYTAQVYLADDESQTEVGTSVYSRESDGSFKFVRRLPFSPNTAFCFARTDSTWHGVEPVKLKKPRNNLHISGFQVDKGE
jgi:hypothetical protein